MSEQEETDSTAQVIENDTESEAGEFTPVRHARGLIDYGPACSRLGITRELLHQWVCRGIVPHIRLTGRTVRFDPGALDHWLEERSVSGKPLLTD